MPWRKKTVIRENTGRSMWIMGVWEVLTGQVTWKHFLMKVIYEHDKTFKWGKILHEKSLSYFPKVTTVKGLLCFFLKKCFMIHLYISLSSVIYLLIPIKNTQLRSCCRCCSITINLFWISFCISACRSISNLQQHLHRIVLHVSTMI